MSSVENPRIVSTPSVPVSSSARTSAGVQTVPSSNSIRSMVSERDPSSVFLMVIRSPVPAKVSTTSSLSPVTRLTVTWAGV